ncbi:MAG TPA: efflux RND transporter periplasmic adaptor subunit [Dongiaceae bacterium]|jgi:Cu(I)/Ag(I) efflux system membrane fusion protein|nr:efflux RND transporter periplasmic adaptor subunit [Dongiaceae bacterium]
MILKTYLAAGGLAIFMGAAGLYGGYRFAHTQVANPAQAFAPATASPATEFHPAYYQKPDGSAEYSPVPKKDEKGRDYIPIYAPPGSKPPVQTQAAPPVGAPPDSGKGGAKKIKFYRNPMGLPDTSPVPKKDSMGMDYIPVYDGENDDDGTVKIGLAKVQKLGVRTEAATKRHILHPVRAVGTIQLDERQESVVNLKFEGWIDKLHVNTTGANVKRGQPLFEIYSPDLVLAQQEYLIARRAAEGSGPAGREIAQAALTRLKNWDISTDQIKRLERTGVASRTLTIQAPSDGLVMEKMAVQGMRFMPGETLYKISNLSTVWVIAQVFEKDLPLVQPGQEARIKIEALPGKSFAGRVNFIYPTVNKDTRTGQVRIEVPNPEGLLKHDMYASLELIVPLSATDAVTVPDSAVLDSGVQQTVLVEKGAGIYEPRPVKLGARTDGYAEILDGVKEGEKVVVSANFLIDAESNLRAALKSFTAPDPKNGGGADAAPGSDIQGTQP